jgi:beta-glucanase (GH16 family)
VLNMNKWLIVLVAVLLPLFASRCSVPTQSADSVSPLILPTASPTILAPTIPAHGEQHLIFHDEFEDGALDTSIWHTEYPWGRTNSNEAQYYTPGAFEFVNGVLRIRADRRTIRDHEYSSGVLASYGNFAFTYGYIEFRAKIPAGQGLWPALWMLPDDRTQSGEIDIVEILGHEPHRAYTFLHFVDSNGESTDEGKSHSGPDYSQEFHLYAVHWSKDLIIWYIDNTEVFRITHHVPSYPMYLLMNLAVGGTWPGYPDESTGFPAYFDIDYVRVYQD